MVFYTKGQLLQFMIENRFYRESHIYAVNLKRGLQRARGKCARMIDVSSTSAKDIMQGFNKIS